jgi:hypothetical protein
LCERQRQVGAAIGFPAAMFLNPLAFWDLAMQRDPHNSGFNPDPRLSRFAYLGPGKSHHGYCGSRQPAYSGRDYQGAYVYEGR